MKHCATIMTLLFVLMIAGAAAPAGATIYYLNDSSTCSNWVKKTITELNATSISPGDEIYFKCDKRFVGELTISDGGTENNRVIVGAYYLNNGKTCTPGVKGNLPIIEGSITIANNANYVTVKNLEVKNPKSYGIRINSKNCIVSGCRIYDNQSNGIYLAQTSESCTIEKNVCYGNIFNQILSYGTKHTLRFNLCYDTDVQKANGINIKIPGSASNLERDDYKIFGNCIASYLTGVKISSENGSTISNSQIVNNTVVGKSAESCISINDLGGTIKNIEVKNNIFYNSSWSSNVQFCRTYSENINSIQINFSNNLWFPALSGSTNCSDTSDITGDPGLVGGDWTNLSAFALRSDSPAKDKGTALGTNGDFLECDGTNAKNPQSWTTRKLDECRSKILPDVGADIHCVPYTRPDSPRNLNLK